MQREEEENGSISFTVISERWLISMEQTLYNLNEICKKRFHDESEHKQKQNCNNNISQQQKISHSNSNDETIDTTINNDGKYNDDDNNNTIYDLIRRIEYIHTRLRHLRRISIENDNQRTVLLPKIYQLIQSTNQILTEKIEANEINEPLDQKWQREQLQEQLNKQIMLD